MIVTYIDSDEINRLSSVHPLLSLAVNEMARLLDEGVSDGCYKINGDDLFINVMTYESHPQCECCFEAHREYIDVQMVIEGEEAIGFLPSADLTLTRPYAPDYELFAMTDKPFDKINLSGKKIVVILPPEPHAPSIALKEATRIRKMVAKIKI